MDGMGKMKDSIFKFLRIDNLVDNLSGYFETRVELMKMEMREEIARVISRGLMIAFLFLSGLLFLVFFSIGFANYLDIYFNSTSAGFWIVSAIYGVPGLIIFTFRTKISQFFESYLMDQVKKKRK